MGLILSGCASLDTRLPDLDAALVDAEEAVQARSAFAEMDKMRARLVDVADRVLAANTALCPKIRPDIGISTQSADSFPKKLRETVVRELGLSETPEVVFVRPGSPADKAGIVKGAVIRLVSGDALSARDKNFETALAEGEPLVVENDGQSMSVMIEPEERCDYRLNLKMTSAVNAYANGKSIIVTSGMMDFVKSDEELAYVIGHELAHNTHKHIRKSIANFLLSGFAHRYTRPFEAEADYVGMYYAARAGYQLDNVEDIWRRLARLSIKPVYQAKTHPSFPNRTVLLDAVRVEIRDKQSQGLPLIPNPKDAP